MMPIVLKTQDGNSQQNTGNVVDEGKSPVVDEVIDHSPDPRTGQIPQHAQVWQEQQQREIPPWKAQQGEEVDGEQEETELL